MNNGTIPGAVRTSGGNLMGCALQAEVGQNPARQAALGVEIE